MHKKITIVAILFGLVGAFLAFLDARRTAYGFDAGGVRLGLGPDYYTWFWRHCGEIGFLCIFVSFVIEFVAALFCKAHSDTKPDHIKGSGIPSVTGTVPDLPPEQTKTAPKNEV